MVYATPGRRAAAGLIDALFLAATIVFLLCLFDGAVRMLAKHEYNLSRELTEEQISKRYTTVFGALPVFKGENMIVKHTFLGMRNERGLTDEAERHTLWQARHDAPATLKITLPDSDVVLMFPPETAFTVRDEEVAYFSNQYGTFVHSGNALDRFRVAFPEFKNISDDLLIETLHEHFFYKLSDDEMKQQFGHWGMKTESEHHYVSIGVLLFLYVLAYFAGLESSAWATTLGKKIMGLKVASDNAVNYNRLTLSAALLYTASFMLSAIGSLFTIYIPLATGAQQRTWYDTQSGAHVVMA
jgi:uncharacterized RDD family membrane protein YckC